MKSIKTVCLIFILLTSEHVFCQNVRFLFIGKPGGEIDKLYLSRGLNDIFLTDAVSAFEEKFPCAGISDPVSLQYCLEELRLQSTPEFGGRNVVPIIKNISTAISNGYKVRYSIYAISDDKAHAEVKCEDKKGNVLIDFSVEMNIMDFANGNRSKFCEMFIEKLSKYEICPFKGDINIKIVGTKKDEHTEQYPVYCNGMDGYFTKTVKIDKHSENNWKITKTGKETATGNVQFNLSEEFTIDGYNPCYDCSSTKQGNRRYNEKTTTYADIQGLSNESESYGVKVDDARAYLTFFDDGTYTLRIKASSTQAEKKTKKEVTAQGTCDNLNDPPETITNKIDEGINEIFGPFTGTAQDKVLSHKDTIKRVNPITDEEEKITYEFNLTRE